MTQRTHRQYTELVTVASVAIAAAAASISSSLGQSDTGARLAD